MRLREQSSGWLGLAAWLVVSWAASAAWVRAGAFQCEYKLDWRHWADVRSVPYLGDEELGLLCDGDIRTGASGAPGPEIGSTIEFRFPEEVRVTEIRLNQRGADALEVSAAVGADGKFDTTLAQITLGDKETQHEQWVVVRVGKVVRGLRLLATDGQPGYRQCYPLQKP